MHYLENEHSICISQGINMFYLNLSLSSVILLFSAMLFSLPTALDFGLFL